MPSHAEDMELACSLGLDTRFGMIAREPCGGINKVAGIAAPAFKRTR